MRASTLTMLPVPEEGWAETAGVMAVLDEQDTAAGGSELGGTLGQLAGNAIGTMLGGSAGSALGSAGGQLAGTLIGGLVEQATKPKPTPTTKPKAQPSNRAQARSRARNKAAARAVQARAVQGAQATAIAPTPPPKPRPAAPPAAAPARPIPPPAPSPPVASKSDAAPSASVAPPATSTTRPAPPPFPPLLKGFREQLTDEQRERFDQAIREKRGLAAFQDLVAERAADRAALDTMEAELARQREAPPSLLLNVPPPEPAATEEGAEYDDAAAPPAKRPRPRKHIGLIPLQRWQLEGLLVKVPTLRKLDPRLLRAMTGNGSTVRDTSGIDPAARTYHAEPGESAVGIAKKLTGKAERAADLLAANPGRRDGDPIWRIPPGWMHFANTEEGAELDTGATSRLYIVKKDDTPVGIATRSGAKAVRPKWWAELKTANPQIPVTDDGKNFQRFFAGDQLWIPEEWPASPMFQPGSGQAPSPLPIPSPTPTPPNTTFDPGVPQHAQAMLGAWALANPGAANPPDYGTTIGDFTGTTTTRFASALASFQTWYNARNAASKLRTDGVLDGPTYQALHASTVGAMTPPGPGAVPWTQPQQPQQQTAPQAPQMQPTPQGGATVPGIHGGIPQLGGWAGPLGPNASPIPLIQTLTQPLSGQAPSMPASIVGTQVPGWPPGATYAANNTISYNGQPAPVGQQVPGMAPGVVWAPGGLMAYQGQPYMPGQPVPGMPGLAWAPYIPGYTSPYIPESSIPQLWPWAPGSQGQVGPSQPPSQPWLPLQPAAQTQPAAETAPKKESGVALPIILAAATMAFSS